MVNSTSNRQIFPKLRLLLAKPRSGWPKSRFQAVTADPTQSPLFLLQSKKLSHSTNNRELDLNYLKAALINKSKQRQTNSATFDTGQHLLVRFGTYQHHGIACGDQQVIHFGRGIFDAANAVVELVSISTFSADKPIQIVDSKLAFEKSEVVDRARSRIGEKGYDLWNNNCEHFVNWCRSGENDSPQVTRAETIARQSSAIASKPFIHQLTKQVAKKHVSFAVKGLARAPSLVACAADTLQATAEIVATKQGKTKSESQQIGRRVGVASSVAIGLAIGGPITAAAGVGFWITGQVLAEFAVSTGKQMVNSLASANQNLLPS